MRSRPLSVTLATLTCLALGLAVVGAGSSPLDAQAADVTIQVDGRAAAGHPDFAWVGDASEVIEYKDGEDSTTHTRPGNHKPGKCLLRRDWSSTRGDWYAWRQAVVNGAVDRKSVSVIFRNDKGEAFALNLGNCWPSGWTVEMNARNSAHATESLEIVFETMDWKGK